jgi:hypothetical protein
VICCVLVRFMADRVNNNPLKIIDVLYGFSLPEIFEQANKYEKDKSKRKVVQ